jgi:hypothetical protein
MRRIAIWHPLALALLAGVSCAAGCGGARAYAPDSGSARKALDTALNAWQSGSKPDTLSSGTSPVHAHDFQWLAGVPLERFEVTGEEDGEGATKRFAVTLTVKSKKGKEEVRTHYVVVGRDPVWVYRGEDYARLLNMDNNPRPAPQRRK